MTRRVLLALGALLGLLAMHGITASTASAAAPCGQAPTHAPASHSAMAHGGMAHGGMAHGGMHDDAPPSAAALAATPVVQGVQVASLLGTDPEPGHAGMLCLAILGMALLLVLRGTRWPGSGPQFDDGPAGRPGTRTSRAPPDDAQAVLCRWRT